MKIPVRSFRAWREDHEPWHKWFAWKPVRIDRNRLAWLETVERSWNGGWDYRSPTASTEQKG